MAHVAFPNVSMESLTLDLIYPGQRAHESVYTGSIQTISRGIGRWQGLMVFPQISRTDGEDTIQELDAFFANLDGMTNTFDCPWEAVTARQVAAFPNGADVRLMSIARTGSTMTATLNQQTGLIRGDRITINNRLFVLVTTLAGDECTLSPYRPLEIPTAGAPVNWQTPTVRARMIQPRPVTVQRNQSWAGPWAAEFTDIL